MRAPTVEATMRKLRLSFAFVAAVVSATAIADQEDFCAGFVEGFQSARGETAPVPPCPELKKIPEGSSAFREGVKQGIRAARKPKR